MPAPESFRTLKDSGSRHVVMQRDSHAPHGGAPRGMKIECDAPKFLPCLDCSSHANISTANNSSASGLFIRFEQGVRRAQGRRHRRCRGRPVQGHGRPEPQHPHQTHEHGVDRGRRAHGDDPALLCRSPVRLLRGPPAGRAPQGVSGGADRPQARWHLHRVREFSRRFPRCVRRGVWPGIFRRRGRNTCGFPRWRTRGLRCP